MPKSKSKLRLILESELYLLMGVPMPVEGVSLPDEPPLWARLATGGKGVSARAPRAWGTVTGAGLLGVMLPLETDVNAPAVVPCAPVGAT